MCGRKTGSAGSCVRFRHRAQPLQTPQLILRMNRQTDATLFVAYRSPYVLPDPESGVSNETPTARRFEPFHRPHQAERTFLHQVVNGQVLAEPRVPKRKFEHESQVVTNDLISRRNIRRLLLRAEGETIGLFLREEFVGTQLCEPPFLAIGRFL